MEFRYPGIKQISILYTKISLATIIILFMNYYEGVGQCSVAILNCPPDLTLIDCDHDGVEPITWPQINANPIGLCNNFMLKRIAGPSYGAVAPIGTYLMIFSAEAMDQSTGLYAQSLCQFFITIAPDVQSPSFTSCPPNIVLYGVDDGTGICNTQAYWQTPVASDDCNNLTTVSNIPCGSMFQTGTTTVVYTATDASGNSTTCSFTVTVICTTSTNKDSDNVEVENLYPNPTSGELLIQLPKPSINEEVIKIVNAAGQVVLEQSFTVNEDTQLISLSTFPDGIYFLHLISNQSPIHTSKVIKVSH